MGSFGVATGHPRRSLITAPFDKVHTVPISLPQHVCPYLAPSLRYSEILVEKRRFQPTPPLSGASVEVISLECPRDFWRKKTRDHMGVVCLIHSE